MHAIADIDCLVKLKEIVLMMECGLEQLLNVYQQV